MIKFKIFCGNYTNVSADVKLNQWLAENPTVELVDWQYRQKRFGDHSICITYKENKVASIKAMSAVDAQSMSEKTTTKHI